MTTETVGVVRLNDSDYRYLGGLGGSLPFLGAVVLGNVVFSWPRY